MKPKNAKANAGASIPEPSEERFRTLLRQSNDAIQLVSPEGVILYSSESVVKVLGYTPEEIEGANIELYIHPVNWKDFGPLWAKLLKNDSSTLTLEYQAKHKNGSWVWVETFLTNHLKTPRINAILGNFRNITERKNAEQQLRESENKLRFMAESMPQKIFTSLPDGTLDYLNPQWVEFSGMTMGKLLEGGITQLIHPEDFTDAQARRQFSLETGEPFSLEYRLRRYDGAYRWHITRARAMCDEQGNIIKWFGSSTDIHDTKTSLQREHDLTVEALTLTKEREELIELNASKDEFISLASHQLRTPATIVKQYLHLLLEGYAGDLSPEIEEMLTRANISNERQIEIVDDLLRVARLDAGKVALAPEMTNLVPLIQEVVNEQHAVLEEHGQKAAVSYSTPGISAMIDKPRMKMVLENILDNASKYSPPGTIIEIAVTRHDNGIEIAITDEGVGIAKEDLPKLFQKFSRLPNSLSVAVGGTGLGLYWAKRIVDLHGGSIRVEAANQAGSTFTISLPLPL